MSNQDLTTGAPAATFVRTCICESVRTYIGHNHDNEHHKLEHNRIRIRMQNRYHDYDNNYNYNILALWEQLFLILYNSKCTYICIYIYVP